jgi:putative spermidine/putrescine transport system substrate-binding protein
MDREDSMRLRKRTTRRAVLLGELLVTSGLGLAAGLADRVAQAADESLVVVSYGGTYQDGLREAFFVPFTNDTGVEIVEDSGGSVPKIKAMVEANSVQWDVVNVSSSEYEVLVEQNLIQKIDYSAFDQTTLAPLPDFAKLEYGVAASFYSCGITYRTDLENKEHPKTWVEFWDTEKFPGPRAMPSANYVIPPWEVALMGDGVDPASLYPIDFDRALASLDKIKGSVKVWYEDTAAGVQSLIDHEVDYAMLCNNRVVAARDKGTPVDVEWNQSLLDHDVWVVPVGSTHTATAMKFLSSMLDPNRQAVLVKQQPIGPSNPETLKLLDPKAASSLPTAPENVPVQVPIKAGFYSEPAPNGTSQLEYGLQKWNAWYGQ